MKEALHQLTIKKFHDGLVNKEWSALEVTQAYLARIKEHDPEIDAYLSTREEAAVREAEAVDLKIAKGEEIPMIAGVPLAIKDNILIKDSPATAASKILENYTAVYDATVIENLKKANAVFLGKTNLDEFAMGASTENSGFRVTKNPHDTTRVPGGSSGGSTAAVAAHEALAALGSDTGGSIRQPSSFCGVVGMKPTYGAVSRSGIIAMSSSLDQVGPIAKTVEDAALLFDAIKGPDALDATYASADHGDFLKAPTLEEARKLVIGLPKEYFADGLSTEVETSVAQAIERLRSLGIKFKEISLPHTKYALSVYYIIMPAEVSSNLARFDGIRYARGVDAKNLEALYLKNRGRGFGEEAKRRIILGTFVLSSGYYDAYYQKAQKVRTLVKRDFENAFKDVDMILTPVAPTPAFKIGEKSNDPLQMYLSDIFTISLNLAGLPGISIPAPSDGLPVGFQLIGKAWHERDILNVGRLYQEL